MPLREAFEDLSKATTAVQSQLVRNISLYFSDQLSTTQAHYLATVIVTTISEGCLFIVFCAIYFVMRAFPMWYYKDYEAEARRHAAETLQWEHKMGILVESKWQGAVVHDIVVMDALAIFYVWGLWVVIIMFHLWVLWFYTTHYAILRNGFWLTTFICGAIFMLRPEAPPRLTPACGVIDSIKTISGYPNHEIGPYDSCPSLHSAWSIIVGGGIFVYLQQERNALVTVGLGLFAVVYPVITFYALVTTGNHWVSDALAGIGATLAGFALSRAPYVRDFMAYNRWHMMAFYQEVNVTPTDTASYQANDQLSSF